MVQNSINPRSENVLILDYNTIKFQSLGFIELVRQNGLESAKLHSLSPFESLQFIINSPDINTSELFDEPVTEEEYFKFIRANYNVVSELSPDTKLSPITSVMSTQRFMSNTYLASSSEYRLDIGLTNNVKRVYFNIFDIKEIEDFIIENKITSVFLHDIRMVFDLVFNLRIPIDSMTFLVSKIGYNFTMIDGKLASLCPEVVDIAEELNFKIAYIDIYDTSTQNEDIVTGGEEFNGQAS